MRCIYLYDEQDAAPFHRPKNTIAKSLLSGRGVFTIVPAKSPKRPSATTQPALLPVRQALAHWRLFAAPSGRLKIRRFFARAASCADAPACRHHLRAQGAHLGALMTL